MTTHRLLREATFDGWQVNAPYVRAAVGPAWRGSSDHPTTWRVVYRGAVEWSMVRA
ncbi:MAG: hypothetical protein ACHQ01_03565 [Candidatus Limnocylindrales bacterium]